MGSSVRVKVLELGKCRLGDNIPEIAGSREPANRSFAELRLPGSWSEIARPIIADIYVALTMQSDAFEAPNANRYGGPASRTAGLHRGFPLSALVLLLESRSAFYSNQEQ